MVDGQLVRTKLERLRLVGDPYSDEDIAGAAAAVEGSSPSLPIAGYDLVVATRDHHIDPGSHFSATPDYVDSWPPHCVAHIMPAAPAPSIADPN